MIRAAVLLYDKSLAADQLVLLLSVGDLRWRLEKRSLAN